MSNKIVETISQSDLQLRQRMQQIDPEAYKTSTFGVEIEVAVLLPQKHDPTYEEVMQWVQTSKSIEATKWRRDVRAVRKEFEGAKYDYIQDNPSKVYNYSKAKYVIEEIKDLIEKNGFKVNEGPDASGELWGVGYDHKNDRGEPSVSEEQETLVEMRTGILRLDQLGDFEVFLEDLSAFIDRDKYVRTHGGTSAHVHVSNKFLTQYNEKDYFLALASTMHMDEPAVKSAAGANRDFDRFANFNSNLYNAIVQNLSFEMFRSNNMAQSAVITNEELGKMIRGIPEIKHHGINIISKFPTIEYRYLSSQILDNPKKLSNWIRYYLVLPIAAKGKSQIKLWENPNKTGNSLTLTKLPGAKVKIDINSKSSKPSLKTADLKTNLSREELGFQKWYNRLSPEEQEAYRRKYA